MADQPPPLTEGWAFSRDSRKAHYFILEEKVAGDRRTFSLCGRYGFFTAAHALEADNGKKSSDDCAPCRKKLDKRGAR